MRYRSHCSALAAVLLISIALLKSAHSATRHRSPQQAQAASRTSVSRKAVEKHKHSRSLPKGKPVKKAKEKVSQAPKSHVVSAEEKHARRAGNRYRSVHLRRAVLRSRRRRLLLDEPQSQATIAEIPLNRAKLAMMPPLRGSHESLIRQNTRADADGLERVEDDEDLNRLVRLRSLVSLPASERLVVNPSMDSNRRYCRPWTAKFLSDLAAAHYQRFKRSLQVNSAIRTVQYQRQLIRINGNAAPAEGDVASPHLTGEAIDIGKKGLSLSQIGWLRAYLLPLQQAGRIDVEEEFVQACFHISVYKSYVPAPPLLENGSKPFIASKVR
jgi:uncharacterized protein YcbK (DUF882 family)